MCLMPKARGYRNILIEVVLDANNDNIYQQESLTHDEVFLLTNVLDKSMVLAGDNEIEVSAGECFGGGEAIAH